MSTVTAEAVGTPAAAMTSLANVFEPSMRAASAPGPKQAIPAARTTSATPATSGISGPITTRSAAHAFAPAATARGVAHVQPVLLGDGRGAGVAGSARQRGDGGVLRQGEDDGVLTGTGTDDQDAHGRQA